MFIWVVILEIEFISPGESELFSEDNLSFASESGIAIDWLSAIAAGFVQDFVHAISFPFGCSFVFGVPLVALTLFFDVAAVFAVAIAAVFAVAVAVAVAFAVAVAVATESNISIVSGGWLIWYLATWNPFLFSYILNWKASSTPRDF